MTVNTYEIIKAVASGAYVADPDSTIKDAVEIISKTPGVVGYELSGIE